MSVVMGLSVDGSAGSKSRSWSAEDRERLARDTFIPVDWADCQRAAAASATSRLSDLSERVLALAQRCAHDPAIGPDLLAAAHEFVSYADEIGGPLTPRMRLRLEEARKLIA